MFNNFKSKDDTICPRLEAHERPGGEKKKIMERRISNS